MGRGNRGQKSGSLPNRELYERMNFLYQSSQFFATQCQSLRSVQSTRKPCSESPHLSSSATAETTAVAVANASSNMANDDLQNISTPLLPLARFYTKEMRQMARKSVLRVSPHVKREICKMCSTPLMPGISCTVRIKGKTHGKRVITTCSFCGTQKRIMANSDHILFVDRPDHGTIN